MQIKIINDNYRFHDLKDRWDLVLENSVDRSITQTWEWLHTWWEVYGEERELLIVIGYENDGIVGIAPFTMPKEVTRHYKILKVRPFWLAASGKTKERNVLSDYLNLIVLQGKEEVFVNALLKWLLDLDTWDEIILENISGESVVPSLLQDGAKKFGAIFQVVKRIPSVLIKLPATWDDFLKSVDGSLRYKITRGRRELNALNATYHLVQDETELPRAFGDLQLLHQARWMGKGKPGAFESAKWKEFHRRVMPLLFKKGWLRLSFLKIGGSPVAANYNFLYNKKVHFFQSGMIPHENKHVRLGLLLHSYCIEEAINEGCTEYDFLGIGGEGPGYKEMWGNYQRDLLHIRIAKPSKKERTYEMISNGINALKRVKRKVQSISAHT